jgi:hypothetical protein
MGLAESVHVVGNITEVAVDIYVLDAEQKILVRG